jgi:hypothetical protein
MLATAKDHFDQDLARTRALLAHAETLSPGVLHDDVLRSGWMMAVGACDAYFSDAYADLISRTLRAKDMEPSVSIPDRLNNLRIPVVAVLRQARGGWRWRMAARELIENENVLSLEKVKNLFNHFFRKHHKLLATDTIEDWILHKDAKQRLFGTKATDYRRMNPSQKGQAKKVAMEKLEARFADTFQRRHDCIHNCDRPKVKVQRVSEAELQKRIEDVEFLVERRQEAFCSEFPVYLTNLGFSASVRSQVLV